MPDMTNPNEVTSEIALQELTCLIRHHTDPEAFQEIRQALEQFAQSRSATSDAAGWQLLAEKHSGMRVDYSGLLKQARAGLRHEPALAEMLRQLQDHLQELGKRWYAGDIAVVDEILQLYCIERDARAALLPPPVAAGGSQI